MEIQSRGVGEVGGAEVGGNASGRDAGEEARAVGDGKPGAARGVDVAKRKPKAKRPSRYIYMSLRKLVDPTTGEEVEALLPWDGIQRRLLRERGFRIGQRMRGELKQERDYPKHKLMHKIGGLLVDNVDGYEHMDCHEAIKDVQAKAGVCCDLEKFVIDLGQFGRHEVERNIPRSISFDEMEEDEFERLFLGATAWIGEHHAHVMLDEVREEFWAMANREQRAA